MRRIIIIIFSSLITAFFIFFVIGRIATSPANRSIGKPPLDLSIETISFIDEKQKKVSGWAIEGSVNHGAVLLLHGIKSDRRSMIGRARMLADSGYSVLLIDLQAHGESMGKRITFGYREADSVVAAIKYIHSRWPKKRLAIIGTSLGGAAAIFAAERKRADAYILEAVYSTLTDATENRIKMRFGNLGVIFSPLLLWQTQLQLGFNAQNLSTIEKIDQIDAPIMIIAGEKDKRTTLKNSKNLFSKAKHPKSLWIIPNAKHQDFLNLSEEEYHKRVGGFLEQHLK
ncbi:MAG: alpha/beta hydrolase [Hyphomicrobiales bacterium]